MYVTQETHVDATQTLERLWSHWSAKVLQLGHLPLFWREEEVRTAHSLPGFQSKVRLLSCAAQKGSPTTLVLTMLLKSAPLDP